MKGTASVFKLIPSLAPWKQAVTFGACEKMEVNCL